MKSILGQRLVARGKGGAVQLTPQGQFLLDRAREMLALNNSIWSSFRTPAMHGTIRLGTPDDYALRYLPQILKRFAESHPSVQVDVTCLPSYELVHRLREGELDLTLCSEGLEPPGWPVTFLWRGPLTWITSSRYTPHRQDPLPIALAAEHCTWRVSAIRALEGAGRRYRIAYHARTQIGTHAPVLAGLAVTVSPASWVPRRPSPAPPRGGPAPASRFRHPDAEKPRRPAARHRRPSRLHRRNLQSRIRPRHHRRLTPKNPLPLAGEGRVRVGAYNPPSTVSARLTSNPPGGSTERLVTRPSSTTIA